MNAERPRPVYRKDYRRPDFQIEETHLHFDLGEEQSVVRSRLSMRRREGAAPDAPLALDGEELETRWVKVNGEALPESGYRIEGGKLTIDGLPVEFTLETEVVIRPQENASLSGLYKSSGVFCTQCEAEGFRRITWYLDRPDVMSRYTTTIVADKERYPILLSNGDRIAEGETENGRHEVSWRDPFRKPSYLFAMVGGRLQCHRGSFTTRSGRDIALEIWVEPQNIDRCAHALESLKQAMRWDEERFGLEYDLDTYMIVAVNDFNMGAMENKGLNIFNSKYVLASPESATDDDYEHIQAVVAHEYFHNWTGNRVTCRDWFQLTLKEGLTVFRDQEFSADHGSPAVKRISDVKLLRTAQFAEDQGPMAHPIRPESYIKMDNFYTVTVYEKGAEVVRMYQTLLGVDGFRKGMDLYFERHDGQAVSCDDFRAAMADANGRDLALFERWYSQHGTPLLVARGEYDENEGSYTLQLRQSCPTNPDFEPLHMPVRMALLDAEGREIPLRLEGEDDAPTERVLELREEERSFKFLDVPGPCTASLPRQFSAPVKLCFERDRDELGFLMAHDSDSFIRWDAGQQLAEQILLELSAAHDRGEALELPASFVDAFGRILEDPRLDGSLKALALTLPGQKLLGQAQAVVAVEGLHAAREFARLTLAEAHQDSFRRLYDELSEPREESEHKARDRRRLRNLCLAYLARLDSPREHARAYAHLRSADNMTDSQAALMVLADLEIPEREAALAEFYERWRDDPLVLDKWFQVQALSSLPRTLERVRELTAHPDFTLRNPNRCRSLVGTFSAGNQRRFHEASGEGYRLLSDTVLEVNAFNPQLAARLLGTLNGWRRFDPARQALMKEQLERVSAHAELSPDVREIVDRALGS